ncbi:hypothetical protein JCM33374_g3240 [Metschnikowia sp. JCM 33374]|nr:hypothetical protein JCM33374_g3240 [Metschnikowia sp. JCM 33374]
MKLTAPLTLIFLFPAFISSLSVSSPTAGAHGIASSQIHISRPPNLTSIQPATDMANNPYIETLEMQLERFIASLKSFISWKRFDYENFQRSMSMLWQQLSHIRLQLEHTATLVQIEAEQFNYAERAFRLMLDATQSMVFFKNDHSLMQVLIYEIVQLNVQILQLNTSMGNVDPSVPGFDYLVSEVRKQLGFLKSVLNFSKEKSDGLLFVFNLEYDKARSSVLVLESYLPMQKRL